MISHFGVAGYRSLRDIRLALGGLTVVTGANSTGKSNLYRALWLLHRAMEGRFARSLADEGGLHSVLWAGPRKRGPVRLEMSVAFDDGLSYSLACGLPDPNDLPTLSFQRDPSIKEETVSFRQGKSVVSLLERGKSGAHLRDADGGRVSLPMTLGRGESALSQLSEPHRYPHLWGLRSRLVHWRFYHGFRTDEYSPLRQGQIGVFTPVLSHDGSDLAAALQTIVEIGDADGLHKAVRQGLNGATLEILYPDDWEDDPRFRVLLHTPGIHRPLEAFELSDGTLRYLCLIAALLSPRPPGLLALNEPETSLHPDLLAPLAARIAEAAQTTQIWVTTHSQILAQEIERRTGVSPITLTKINGETSLG